MQAADSAGIPFEGREFRPHPFAGDDGGAPERLALALSGWTSHPSGVALTEVVESLRDSRVLVPLVAEAGDFGHTAEGRVV
ncbi:MAG: SseB family protein, partial [Pontimonas sp.]